MEGIGNQFGKRRWVKPEEMSLAQRMQFESEMMERERQQREVLCEAIKEFMNKKGGK